MENSYTHIQPPPAFSPRNFFLIGLEVVIYAVFHFTEPFFLRVLNFADRGHSAKSDKNCRALGQESVQGQMDEIYRR